MMIFSNLILLLVCISSISCASDEACASVEYNTGESTRAVFKKSPRLQEQHMINVEAGERAFSEASKLHQNGMESTALPKFMVAADNGHIIAQMIVGMAYMEGSMGAIRKDPHLAQKYLSLAADNGDSDAQTQLGSAYLGLVDGSGIPFNPLLGVKYLEMAVSQENLSAVAVLCYHLIGIESLDRARAIMNLPFVLECHDEDDDYQDIENLRQSLGLK